MPAQNCLRNMDDELSRDNLPRGWSLARWDAAKHEVRSVIWRTGELNQLVSYKGLSLQLKAEPIYWQSAVLRGVLNEIATDERARGGPWVTAIVVRSGSTCPGEGFFKLVPEREWSVAGRLAFTKNQQALAMDWISRHPDVA